MAGFADFVASIDQGTTSTRCMIFDHDGTEVGRHQLEHEQILPRAGWVEHNPVEIWERTASVLMSALNTTNLSSNDLAALGITNQRETDPGVGPAHRPAVLQRDRLAGHPHRPHRVGAGPRRPRRRDPAQGRVCRRQPTSPAAKCSGFWRTSTGCARQPRRGDAIFGTPDTWVLWNLTGGPRGGVHVTDVTNASRTMLMDLETLDWDDELLSFFGIPRQMLPAIAAVVAARALRRHAATTGRSAGEVPITGILGDQQAAMVGQVCLDAGEAKNTYGTGNFLLLNTGEKIVRSRKRAADDGVLPIRSTPNPFTRWRVRSPSPARRCSGCATSWASSAGPRRARRWPARSTTTAACTSCPAFSGLFAPYWRSDARGAIVGLSRFNTNAHLARATLEAICYQSRDVVDAMEADSGVHLEVLKVDGGITANDLCMQIQADVLGVDVVKPVVAETTALGAAYAAGLAVGFWASPDDLRANWQEDKRWTPDVERRRSAPPAMRAGGKRCSARWTGSTCPDRPRACVFAQDTPVS